MERDQPDKTRKSGPSSREARLKAALKANMGRRKAQARARAGSDQDKDGDKSSEG